MSNARWLVGGAWRAAVPEWEEPRHHGPIKVSTQYPTSPHLATHLPTFLSEGVRRPWPGRVIPLVKRLCGGVSWWGTHPRVAARWLQFAVLHGRLRPSVGIGRG